MKSENKTKFMATATSGAGLEGVVATTSSICYIDGERGILSYNGYNINTLAENATFEEVIFLLWQGRLPNRQEILALRRDLVAERQLPKEVLDFLKHVPATAAPMDVLRTGISMLGMYDASLNDHSMEANRRRAVKLMSRVATITTAYNSFRNGRDIVPGNPDLGYAANFLYTLTGKVPDEFSARVFDVALILHADHELNASTFAGRVVAATLSDIYSAATAAIGALKGPLHGGANEAVIHMLLATGSPEEAVEKVRSDLSNKTQKIKISGFGHRVYRVLDPRAIHLKRMSEELGRRTGTTELYEKSTRIEQTVREMKNLNANVDFYSASTYYALGIPIDLFTTIFAVSRMSGWTAHVLEQYANNRLIRPRADYTGCPDGQPWVAIEDRPQSDDKHAAD
jgi:citrate synthase